DLSETILSQAYLANANLTNATLRQVYFGQEPYLVASFDLGKCAYSPDGKWIAGCGYNQVSIWSNETNEVKHHLALDGGYRSFYFMLFSVDGEQLIVGHEKKLSVIAVNSGKVLPTIGPQISLGDCRDIAFTSDGKLWVAYFDKKKITVYD